MPFAAAFTPGHQSCSRSIASSRQKLSKGQRGGGSPRPSGKENVGLLGGVLDFNGGLDGIVRLYGLDVLTAQFCSPLGIGEVVSPPPDGCPL